MNPIVKKNWWHIIAVLCASSIVIVHLGALLLAQQFIGILFYSMLLGFGVDTFLFLPLVGMICVSLCGAVAQVVAFTRDESIYGKQGVSAYGVLLICVSTLILYGFLVTRVSMLYTTLGGAPTFERITQNEQFQKMYQAELKKRIPTAIPVRKSSEQLLFVEKMTPSFIFKPSDEQSRIPLSVDIGETVQGQAFQLCVQFEDEFGKPLTEQDCMPIKEKKIRINANLETLSLAPMRTRTDMWGTPGLHTVKLVFKIMNPSVGVETSIAESDTGLFIVQVPEKWN